MLLARHTYSPGTELSSAFVNSYEPSAIFVAMKAGTGYPSLSSSTVGSGRPIAEQLRVKLAPSLTVILAGCTIKVGTRAVRRGEREREREGERDQCYQFGL